MKPSATKQSTATDDLIESGAAWMARAPKLPPPTKPSTSKAQSAAPTFAALAKAIPALAEIEREIRAIRSYPSFCANDVWYGEGHKHLEGFKGVMSKLVGWEARGPAWVQTGQAYDVAYRHLYALLPACRECRCARPGDLWY